MGFCIIISRCLTGDTLSRDSPRTFDAHTLMFSIALKSLRLLLLPTAQYGITRLLAVSIRLHVRHATTMPNLARIYALPYNKLPSFVSISI